MKILVVDDSDYARKRIGKILRDGGHEVIEADGGKAALLLDEETKPQAVTVDLLMPEMDGIELIRRLRARRPEMGNVVLNAAIAVLADKSNGWLRVSLPGILLNRSGEVAVSEVMYAAAGADNSRVFVSRLIIGGVEMICYLILLLSEENVKRILAQIVR